MDLWPSKIVRQLFPGRDQDATVVIGEEKQLAEVAIRLAAWNGPYLITSDLLQPIPSLRGIKMAPHHRQSFEI